MPKGLTPVGDPRAGEASTGQQGRGLTIQDDGDIGVLLQRRGGQGLIRVAVVELGHDAGLLGAGGDQQDLPRLQDIPDAQGHRMGGDFARVAEEAPVVSSRLGGERGHMGTA